MTILLRSSYLLVIARDLTMKVEYHTFLFQSPENGVVWLVRFDTGRRMCRHTSRVRFDS